MTAYRTASDHLDLLKQASDALQNGDVQLFNRVGNEIAKQTGQAAPTNFAAVRAMLAGELANVAKVSGATDPEIKEQRDYILSQNSPEQIAGLVDTNQHLMDQKAQEMFQQYESGMQGQPVFSKGGAKNHPTPTGGMIRAVDEKGVLHEAPAGTPLPKGWKAQ
jgi:hypothetical protein